MPDFQSKGTKHPLLGGEVKNQQINPSGIPGIVWKGFYV